MEIKKATLADLEAVHHIVHDTVKEIYPNYYPFEVVNFFLNYHNYENMTADIEKGNVYLLSDEYGYIGTGSIYQGNYIGRLYVLPRFQGKGYGSAIFYELEKILFKEYKTVLLEASLPSYDFYLKHGYRPIEYHKYEVENHRILCYYIMEKAV